QLYRGDTQGLFQATRRSDLSTVEHLRAYRDISESTNLSIGGSFARGHSPFADANNQLYGIDTTLRWRPLRRSIYRSFVGRSEIVWSRRGQSSGLQVANGYYVSGDYQFGRRWFAGARVDRSHRASDASLLDNGGSIMLTYWPSEFSQVRGQYRRTNYADGPSANELLFQIQFSIGAHGAHPF